jgi:spectinomycin phosphotransferase
MAIIEEDALNSIFSMVIKHYGLEIDSFKKLKLGADKNTHAYKVGNDKTEYFLKIRSGCFNELSIEIQNLLAKEKNIGNVIKPIETLDGKSYINYSSFYICLYPFIKGKNCWNCNFSKDQWNIFGKVLYTIHNTDLSNNILNKLPKENYNSRSRGYVYNIINKIEGRNKMLIREYVDFLLKRKDTINKIISEAENKSKEIKMSLPDNCLCHGDLHAGNIMVTEDDKLFFVDWDTIIYAPKERDLMFIGGGIGNKWNTPEEINCFYNGYKNNKINGKILSYYRFERIIEDIEEYDYQIIDPSTNTDEKINIVNILESQFDKNNVVDMAFQTDIKIYGNKK